MQLVYPGQGPQGSYLSNQIPNPVNISQAMTNNQSQALAENAAKQTFNTQYDEHAGESTMERLVKYGSAGVIDTVDTIASVAPYIERGDIWNLTKGIDTSGLADWQARNKSGVELTSGLLTSVAGGYMAERYIIGALGSRLMASTAISNSAIVQAGARYMATARETALATQTAAAESGIAASLLAPGMPRLMGAYAMKNAAHGAVAEATILGIGHNNDFLWTDDMATNMFWSGLGIGVPALAGLVQGRAAIRAMASDPSILKIRTQARDPHGYVQQRDIIGDPSLPRNPDVELDPAAEVTQAAMEWRQKIDVNNPTPTLRSSRSITENQMSIETQNRLAKLAAVPDQYSSMRKINMADNSPDIGVRRNIVKGLHDDPTLMMEVDTIGTGDIAKAISSKQENIKALEAANDPDSFKIAQKLKKQVPYVLIEGKWYRGSKEATDFAGFEPRAVKINNKGAFQYEVIPPGANKGKILNPAAKINGFTGLPVAERLSYLQGLKELSLNVRRAPVGVQPGMILKNDSDWLQHEFAAYHIKEGGTIDLAQSTYKNLDEVRFGALKAKISQMKQDGVYGHYMDQWTRLKYNLPAATEVELIEDGSSKALNTVLDQVDRKTVNTYAEAKELYNEILNRHEMIAQTRAPVREFEGDMWNFNFNPEGKWYEPVIAWHEPRTMDINKRGLRVQLAESTAKNKQHVFQELASSHVPNSASQAMVTYLHATPEGQLLHDVSGLSNDMATGMGPGVRAEAGALLPTIFRNRDNKKVVAAVRSAQEAENIADSVTRVDHAAFGDTTTRLTASVNKRSQLLYDTAVSFRPGWELKPGFETVAEKFPDGKAMHKLVLDHESAWNKQRMGRDIQPGEHLKNHNTGEDIVFDDLAREHWEKFTDRGWIDPTTGQKQISITEKMRLDENKVRSAFGLAPIRHTPHYIPSQNTKNKFMGWVIDSDTGLPVPGHTVVADTADEFRRGRQRMEEGIKNSKNLYFHSQAEIASTQDVWDQAQMYFVDAHFVGRKNASAKGNLVGDVIRKNTAQEHMQWIRDKNISIANSAMRASLADQIQIAKMYREVDRLHAGQAVESDAKVKPVGTHTVWDDYLKAVAGPMSAEVNSRRITNALTSAEDFIQPIVNMVWTGVNKLPTEQAANYVHDIFTRFGVNLPSKAKSFDELTTQLGPHMPYKTLGDYIEQTRNAKRPPQVAEITGKMNRLTASFMLRYLEIPNAAMNMLGVIDNMQAVTGNTPVLGQLINGRGVRVPVLDRIKIITGGTKEWMKRTYHEDWEYAAAHGGLEPGIAEIRRTMAAIDNTSDWKRVFLGDKSIKNAKPGTRDWLAYHGVDGMASLLNDTTESWSRQWSHGIGLKLADFQGITGKEARFNFANSIADAAIANYSPLNRGEVYQTALGSLAGLFQTYSMNYTQRMFRYLELGDYAALMRQSAAQTLMFGAKSNLGYNALEGLEGWFAGRDNDSTLSDVIYAKYGPLVGSTIAHGGIADLAMLLGAPTGIALYNRADTNIRTNMFQGSGAGIDPFKAAASLGVVKNLAKAIWEIGTMPLQQDSSLQTSRHVSEVLASELPNRTMKGVISLLFNDGTDVDQYGAVTGTTAGYFESTLKMMGLRSTRQQDEIDFKYANKASLTKQAAQMEQLREETRAVIRSGQASEKLADIWQAYQDRGGNPAMFKSWIRQNIEAATTTSALREFKNGLNSPKMQLMIARQGWVDPAQ